MISKEQCHASGDQLSKLEALTENAQVKQVANTVMRRYVKDLQKVLPTEDSERFNRFITYYDKTIRSLCQEAGVNYNDL